MLTHKKIEKALWENDILTLQDGWKMSVVILHIYVALAIFLLFCDDQDTGSESR